MEITLAKGTLINDVTQLGGGGFALLWHLFEVISKAVILVWPGGGGQRISTSAWRHLWMVPNRTKPWVNFSISYKFQKHSAICVFGAKSLLSSSAFSNVLLNCIILLMVYNFFMTFCFVLGNESTNPICQSLLFTKQYILAKTNRVNQIPEKLIKIISRAILLSSAVVIFGSA